MRVTRTFTFIEPTPLDFGFQFMMPGLEGLNSGNVPVGATEEAIQGLKKKEAKHFKITGMQEEKCPVCCEEFSQKSDDTIVLEMPCGHKFCEGCL